MGEVEINAAIPTAVRLNNDGLFFAPPIDSRVFMMLCVYVRVSVKLQMKCRDDPVSVNREYEFQLSTGDPTPID
jgi:hypothetical protein